MKTDSQDFALQSLFFDDFLHHFDYNCFFSYHKYFVACHSRCRYIKPLASNINNRQMHLTNYAVNSQGENFNNDVAEDTGTKRTLQAS